MTRHPSATGLGRVPIVRVAQAPDLRVVATLLCTCVIVLLSIGISEILGLPGHALPRDAGTFSSDSWTKVAPTVAPPSPPPNWPTGSSPPSMPAMTRQLAQSVPNISWEERPAGKSPPPIQHAMMAYDSTDGYEVLFGGTNATAFLFNETWIFTSGNWTQLHPPRSPPPTAYASLADDPHDGYVVLFGVSSNSTTVNQTWTFKSGNWTQSHPSTSPPARSDAAMAYSPPDNAVVLFGGASASGFLNDTWKFSAGNWTNASTTPAPDPRGEAGFAYDSGAGGIVLFGGNQGAFTLFGDTWLYSNDAWARISTHHTPGTNYGVSMASDPRMASVIQFGGGWSISGTWMFLNSDWVNVTPPISPVERAYAGFAYDSRDGSDVLFGGWSEISPVDLNDTWMLNYTIVGNVSSPAVWDAGSSVHVSATASGGTPPYSFYWAFGDGRFMAGSSVNHTYAKPGTYTVVLNSSDWLGEYSFTRVSITINASMQIVPIASPSNVDAGRPVAFSLAVKFGSPPFGFSWEFGDGSRSRAQSTNHSYVFPGLFAPGVWVNDSAGGSVFGSLLVLVHSNPTVSVYFAPQTAEVGVPESFNASATSGVPYYTYQWSFGDGSFLSSTNSTVAHTYTSAGRFPVGLIVVDQGEGAVTSGANITVNESLSADPILGVPRFPEIGMPIHLSSHASFGVPPYSYAWILGDGTLGSGATLTHGYARAGTFALSVTVSDSAGGRVTVVTMVGVPNALGIGPVSSPPSIRLGDHLSITALPHGGFPPYTLTWAGLPQGCVSGDSPYLNCTPSTTGSFEIYANVTDLAGVSASIAAELNIAPPRAAPAASIFTSPDALLVLLSSIVVATIVGLALTKRSRKRKLRREDSSTESGVNQSA